MDGQIISVVTPCLNSEDFIAESIESVLRQKHTAVEHIVVDGGSTDGTLDILAGHPHLRVVSEPDSGLYDAINKGFSLATGEVIAPPNADDVFLPDILSDVAARFSRDSALDMITGRARHFAGSDIDNRSGSPEETPAHLSNGTGRRQGVLRSAVRGAEHQRTIFSKIADRANRAVQYRLRDFVGPRIHPSPGAGRRSRRSPRSNRLCLPPALSITYDGSVPLVNGGARRDHRGGVRRDRLAAAGLSP